MYSIYAGDELLYSDVYPLETRKVTSPTLKMGVDEAGSLEFTVSEVNKCYTKLLRMKTIITVKKFNPTLGPNGDEEAIWDGRILREDRDFYKNKKLYVEGALAFLNDSCQPIKEYKNKSLEQLVTDILKEHADIVKDPARNLYWGGKAESFTPPELEYWSTAYEYTIDSIKNLAEYLECHFVVRKDPDDGLNKIYFFKEEYEYSKQSIIFGENLMDYTENYDLSKMATVLLPLCQTDRESADAPKIVGTDVDLTTQLDYDENRHYGVLLPLSNNTICRKQLTVSNRQYSNVPIPPHRNCLNVILKEVDETNHTYKFDKPDFLGEWVNDGTYVIPEYVKIWKCIQFNQHYSTIDEARDAHIDPTPVINGRTYFDFVSSDRFLIYNDSAERMALAAKYSKNCMKDGAVWVEYKYQSLIDQAEKYRTFKERAIMDYDQIMSDYGILEARTGYQTAIVEIDASHFKTIYLSANGPVYSGDFRTLTLWKKSSSFDEDTSYVRHLPLFYPAPDPELGPEPYIFASYTQAPSSGLFFYPTYAVTVGYELQSQGDQYTVDDLVQNSSISPWVLNHDKYSIAKEFDVDYCFEKKIDLVYPPAGSTFESLGESKRMLLIISGSSGSLGLTLVSNDDKKEDSTISIGLDPDGVDLSAKYPYRAYEANHTTWIPNAPGSFDPWYIYADDSIPEEYKLQKYYGVLTEITQGVQLPDKTQMDTIGPNPHFNIWNDGSIDLEQLQEISIIKESLSDEYRCCVFVTKASYEAPNGKKYPNSIYITTQMQGKGMMYCIIEFTDGHDGNGVWDVDVTTEEHLPHPDHGLRMCEEREYGKYISGITTLDAKKVTMPYSKTQNRIMFVIICSYGSDPKVWIHDPKLANKMQYLTIASANDGSTKLRSDSSNKFLSGLEYGDLNQNGSDAYTLTNNRLRTKNYIPIKANGDYLLTYEGTGIQARAYIYDHYDENDGTHGYSLRTNFEAANPFILLPYMYEGYEVRFVFRKSDNSAINSTDVRNIMLYSEASSKNMLFAQGKMIYETDPITGIIAIDIEDDQTDDENYVTTADSYKITTRKCELIARIDLNRQNLPTIYSYDENTTYLIEEYIPIITTWHLDPTLVTAQDTSVSIEYRDLVQHFDTNNGMVQITAKENELYRFQVKLQITYEDENQETQFAYIPIEPNYVRTFSVSQLVETKKEFVPASNAYETYGHIEKRIEFEHAESSQELLERAKKYLRQSQFDEMQLKVKALDMTVMGAQVDNLRIADKINVSSPPHGVYRDFIIRTMSIPFDKPEDTTFELGWDNKDSLSKLIRKEKSKW